MKIFLVTLAISLGAIFSGNLHAQACPVPKPHPTATPNVKQQSIEVMIERREISENYRSREPQIRAEIERAAQYHNEAYVR